MKQDAEASDQSLGNHEQKVLFEPKIILNRFSQFLFQNTTEEEKQPKENDVAQNMVLN